MTFRNTNKNIRKNKKNKKKLPCIACVVRAACFSEKQATKKAKYLRFTLKFTDLCAEAMSVLRLINAAKDLVMSFEEMEAMDIDNLFVKAVEYFNMNFGKYDVTSFFMFQTVIEKNPDYLSPQNGDNAYYYLASLYNNWIGYSDDAIEHFTKAVELAPYDCESFEKRGFCWEKKGDLKKALVDFKKAKEIDDNRGLIHPDIDEIIKETELKISKNSN